MSTLSRYLSWSNVPKPPSPQVLAVGLTIVGIIGSILGLESRFGWLYKKLETKAEQSDVKPRRKSNLFPESVGAILPAERDAKAEPGPTPCATDTYFNIRPSSYDENSGVYVEWSFGGDVTILDKTTGGNTLGMEGWTTTERDYHPSEIEDFGSPISSYEQPHYYTPASTVIPLRRGPIRRSFSGYSRSMPSVSRTPYDGGDNFTPAQTTDYLSPEMSPNYYTDDVSPHYDTCRSSHPSVSYDPPETLSGLFPQPPISETFALEPQNKEWYQGELISFEETSCNPSLLSIEDVPEPQLAKTFVLSPKLEIHECHYSTSGLAYDEKAVLTSPDSSSPLSLSSQTTSPSTTSPPGVRQSDGLFACTECDATFRVKGYLTRHLKKHAENKAYTCPFYDPEKERPCHPTGGFSRRDTFKAHLKSRHFTYPKKTRCSQRSLVGGHCRECGEHFDSNEIWAERHVRPRLCKGIVEDL